MSAARCDVKGRAGRRRYAGTLLIRLVSSFLVVAACLIRCGRLAALLMAWRHETVMFAVLCL